MSFYEQALPHSVGNNGHVVRVGDTVRRPVGPHTPAVHAFLRHLERTGFAGAPRVLGFDEQGREVLTYLPGDVPGSDEPWAATDEALLSVVALVRELHEAARGFVPPDDAEWGWPAAPEHRSDLVGHNDYCRDNVVFREGRAVAFIDFDWTTTTTPVWELANVVAHWVVRMPGDHDARLRLVREAYPVEGLGAAMLRRNEWGTTLIQAKIGEGHPGFTEMWRNGGEERSAALRAWVAEHVHDR
ncbi:MAG TPA: aminoglycoside phosphotransferase family protein [Frankiaceae bacterium]|nr:aminoglycoside phosphotransferase family protein [Frankiaceae bacterium]